MCDRTQRQSAGQSRLKAKEAAVDPGGSDQGGRARAARHSPGAKARRRRKARYGRSVPLKRHTISGGYGWRVPPVPIPNTAVKPPRADGTWLVTARESRSPPDSIRMLEKFTLLQHSQYPPLSPYPSHPPHPAFLSSSMAEHSAVNRRVVGSSPTWGARNMRPILNRAFFFFSSF